MRHRHLDPVQDGTPSSAHIDDIIERGTFEAWLVLGKAVCADRQTRRVTKALAEKSVLVSERSDRPLFWTVFCGLITREEADCDR